MNWGQFAIAAVVNAALAAAAFAAGSVNVSGVVGGFVVGFVMLYCGGWPSFAVLLTFFVCGSVATRLGYSKKAALGVAQEEKGRRGARHAFANAGTSALAALLIFLGVRFNWPARLVEAIAAVLAGGLATALFDTVSSEIGQLYGRHPFLITTLRPVPVGTDGAVSLEGTLAGLGGGLLVGAVGALVGLYGVWGILFVTAGAFIGTTFESIMGAVGSAKERFNNEVLNFLNTLVGGVSAGLLVYFLVK